VKRGVRLEQIRDHVAEDSAARRGAGKRADSTSMGKAGRTLALRNKGADIVDRSVASGFDIAVNQDNDLLVLYTTLFCHKRLRSCCHAAYC